MKVTRLTYSYKEYGTNDKDYPTGDTCIVVAYPTIITAITVKFFDSQAIQQPNTDIYYQVDIGFKPPYERSETGIRAVMRIDEQHNYIPHPSGVVSQIIGHGCRHEKYELSDEHLEQIKDAIKSFLTKIRETTT